MKKRQHPGPKKWTGTGNPPGHGDPLNSPTRKLRSTKRNQQENAVNAATLSIGREGESDREGLMNNARHDEQEMDKSKDTTTSPSAGGGNDEQQEEGDGKTSDANEYSGGNDRESVSDKSVAGPNTRTPSNSDDVVDLVDTDTEDVNNAYSAAKENKSDDSIPQGTKGNETENVTNMSERDNADDKASDDATNENKSDGSTPDDNEETQQGHRQDTERNETEGGRNASESDNADNNASDEDDNDPPTRRKNETKADFDKLNRTIEVNIHPSHLVLNCGIVVNTDANGEEYFQLTSKVNHSVRQKNIVIEILNNFIGNPGQVESRTAASMHNDLPHFRLAHLVSDTANV